MSDRHYRSGEGGPLPRLDELEDAEVREDEAPLAPAVLDDSTKKKREKREG